MDTNSDNVKQYIDHIICKWYLFWNNINWEYITRLNNDTGSKIDHIITDILTTYSFYITLHDNPISDHRLIFAPINTSSQTKVSNNDTTTFKVIEYDKINRTVISQIKNSTNIETFTDNIQNCIQNYIVKLL